MFEASRTYRLFTKYFDEELYRYAANYYETHDSFTNERRIYAVVGVTRVLEDVEISQRNFPLYLNMKRFLEQDLHPANNDNAAQTVDKAENAPQIKNEKDAAQVLDKFSRYFTARVDIKLMTTQGDFKIVYVSDNGAKVYKPAWLQKGGIGHQIQSYAGKLEIVAKSGVDGRIRLNLKGLDIRNPENKSKRIPYWIGYTKLIVNDEVIFDTLTPAWHDKQYSCVLDVKANDEIKIQVEWLPHRSDV